MATQYTAGIVTGQKWTAAIANQIGAAWESFTPTWTSSGTQPAIGNGTLIGKYTQIQKLVIAEMTVTMGSTTTYGTGNYRLGLPITAKTPLWAYAHTGTARIYDASTATIYVTVMGFFAGATTYVQGWTNGAAGGAFGATVPMTFAVSDEITVQVCYEAA